MFPHVMMGDLSHVMMMPHGTSMFSAVPGDGTAFPPAGWTPDSGSVGIDPSLVGTNHTTAFPSLASAGGDGTAFPPAGWTPDASTTGVDPSLVGTGNGSAFPSLAGVSAGGDDSAFPPAGWTPSSTGIDPSLSTSTGCGCSGSASAAAAQHDFVVLTAGSNHAAVGWVDSALGKHFTDGSVCYDYTLQNGEAALVPGTCSAAGVPSTLSADASCLLLPSAALSSAPAAAAPAAEAKKATVVVTEEELFRLLELDCETGEGQVMVVIDEEQLFALMAAEDAAAKSAAAESAVAAVAKARASPGHLVACGHACLYGAFDATRIAAAKGRLSAWKVDFAAGSQTAAAALSPVAGFVVRHHTAGLSQVPPAAEAALVDGDREWNY